MGNHIVSLHDRHLARSLLSLYQSHLADKPSSLTRSQTHTYTRPNQPANQPTNTLVKMQFFTFILAALMSVFAAAQNATVFDQSFCSGQPQVSGGYTYNSSNPFPISTLAQPTGGAATAVGTGAWPPPLATLPPAPTPPPPLSLSRVLRPAIVSMS